MKTTYLVNKVQPDGSLTLSIATSEEWLEAVRSNKQLPQEQRRHFILDYILDGNELDCMVIETSFEEYLKWDKEWKASARNWKAGQRFPVLSLDVPAADLADAANLSEMIPSSTRVEEAVCDSVLMESLRMILAQWKPWGNDMLNVYLCGLQRDCTAALAQKYGVSLQVIRKYKRQFEEFIKKFLAGVSF